LKVEFKNKKLEKCHKDSKEAIKKYGEQVGRKYIQRVDLISDADTSEDLVAMKSLRCHPLKGDRDGQWAMNLTGFDRLIFQYDDGVIKIATIEEVSKHYGD